MMASFRKPTLIGFAIGLGIAASCTLLFWLNDGNQIMELVINLFAGFPVLAARKLNVPESLFYLLFFIYWGLNGATFARLLANSGPIRRATAIALAIALVTAHRAAQVKLEGNLHDVIKALVQWLSKEIS